MTKKFKLKSGKKKHAYLHKRHNKEIRFQLYGITAMLISFTMLAILLISIISRGYTAFVKTEISLPIEFSESVLVPDDDADYGSLVKESLKKMFPEASGRSDRMLLYKLISNNSSYRLKNLVNNNNNLIGKTVDVWFFASADVDIFEKGYISREIEEDSRQIKDKQIVWLDKLKEQGRLRKVFNTTFFTEGDSREPEQAGMLGSFIGSLFTILACMLLAAPIGVFAAIYLEEFARANVFTDFIEINISNLAAVPSIIYGLLGLAVYLNFFGLPRSSSLVGGLTLAMLVLPTIIITTRNAIKAVPPSIKDAATALGASRMQMVFHHIFPAAMPGIMTGVVLSVARTLGETAPLLMIGMVAFIADVPKTMIDPATTLPVQVFLWSDSPEMAFVEKTAACIIVLLVLLAAINGFAAYIRNKFEVKWE